MSALADLTAAYEARRAAPWAADPNAVGVIGLDVPIELIMAAGLRPVPVFAEPTSTGAAAFAEGKGSPYLRGLAAALTEGPYSRLRRLLISTTPSALAALYAFVREIKRANAALADLEVHLFDLNRGPSPSMVAQRRTSVAGLRDQIAAWAGRPITDADVAAAIQTANRVRAAQSAVQTLREAAATRLSGAEALAVLGAAPALSAEDYVAKLEALAAELAARPALSGRRAVYSGSETAAPDLYRRLEGQGLVIVADDQDAGDRAIGPLVDEDGDPIAALAARYYGRDPSSARAGVAERCAYLLGLVRRAHAEHVVFHIAPFDHPPAWDYPTQRQALTDAGVSFELIEDAHG